LLSEVRFIGPLMYLTVTVAFALVAFAFAVDDCGRTPVPPDETRIVGGKPAVPYSWPWQAEMCFGSWGSCSLRCGATLIDNNWIMCAAHCVDGYEDQPEMFHFKLGTYDYRNDNEPGEVIVNVTRVFKNPQYGSPNQFSNDMSILQLATPVMFTDHIQPVCVPKNIDALAVEGNSCFVTGWGTTSEGGSISNELRQVIVPFINLSTCQQEYPNMVDETMVCAGRAGVDSCQGDSGGPLVTKHADNGRWYQAGIVSWGRGCAEAGYAGVYGRTSAMCAFIQQVVGYDLCIDT